MVEHGLESSYAERLKAWADDDEDETPARPEHEITTYVPCADYFEIRDQALLAHATQVDPERRLVRLPGRGAARGVADRGLSSGQVGGGY